MKDIADLLGRIFIAFLFIYEALDSLVFYDKTKATMSLYGLTWHQDFLLVTIIFILLFGAILVLIGYYANFGAILLILYWLPFTLIVYSFWDDPQEEQRKNAVFFMRNFSNDRWIVIING